MKEFCEGKGNMGWGNIEARGIRGVECSSS